MSETENIDGATQRQGLVNLLTEIAAEGHADLFAGKRDRQRFATSRRFELTVCGESTPLSIAVVLRNISGSGMALWSHHEVAANTSIRVREFASSRNTPWLEGKVTHCTPGVGGYLLGIAFTYPLAPHERPERPPGTIDASEPSAQEETPRRPIGLIARLFAHR